MNRRDLEEILGALLVFLGTCFILSMTWVGTTLLRSFFSDNDERISKQEWSIIRAVERAHRNVRLVAPMLVRQPSTDGNEARTLLGLPAVDGSGNVWILLDPTTPPSTKVLPNKDFSLTGAQLADLELHVGSEEVRRFLKAHTAE